MVDIIKFRFPVIEQDMNLSLDNGEQVELVVCLSRGTYPQSIEVTVDVAGGDVTEHPTYKRIKEYIEEKYGFKVHSAYITLTLFPNSPDGLITLLLNRKLNVNVSVQKFYSYHS